MKKSIAFILHNLALILLLTSIPGQFVLKGNDFDIYYAVSTCAGISLLLISIAISANSWGTIPVAIVFGCIGIYFAIDFSIFDDFVETEKAGILIIIISSVCYVYSLIQQLWRK